MAGRCRTVLAPANAARSGGLPRDPLPGTPAEGCSSQRRCSAHRGPVHPGPGTEGLTDMPAWLQPAGSCCSAAPRHCRVAAFGVTVSQHCTSTAFGVPTSQHCTSASPAGGDALPRGQAAAPGDPSRRPHPRDVPPRGRRGSRMVPPWCLLQWDKPGCCDTVPAELSRDGRYPGWGPRGIAACTASSLP